MQPTPLIVSGSRSFAYEVSLQKEFFRRLDEFVYWTDDVVLYVGDAVGADVLAVSWAEDRWYDRRVYDAHWADQGKAAGPLRNGRMFKDAGPEALFFAAWDGRSPGTANAITLARKHLNKSRIRVWTFREKAVVS